MTPVGLLAAATTVHQTEQVVFHTLLQLIAILAIARLAVATAVRLGQPRAVGEIIGGLVMGPTLFGKLFPAQFAYVFQSTSELPLMILSQVGLALLMFQIGLEFDFSHLRQRQNRRTTLAVSWAGIAVPFVLGWLLGHWSHERLAAGINPLGYRLFMAVAMSITAIPILGRIMMELNLHRSRLGAITITAAAVDDVTGWVLLAVVSALTTAAFAPGPFAGKVGGLAAYVGFCLVVVKPWLRRVVDRFQPSAEGMPADLLAIVLVLIFLSGIVTFWLGVFVIFGGFVMGVLLHDHRPFAAAWQKSVAPLVTVFFLPIFFTYTGLRTNVNALDSVELWGWCAVVLLCATAGKFAGCAVAARWSGLSWPEAGAVGIMMNTRALMELVVVNVGYELGVIPERVFTMLVLMAIVTTVITAPLLRRYLKRMPGARAEEPAR
jgi:Kef-type K+ transport system membrane component KefB